MAKKKASRANSGSKSNSPNNASFSADQLLVAALERGGDNLETGRTLVTFKEGREEEGLELLNSMGMRTADARDFDKQAISLENVSDANSIAFPEIGVALLSSEAAMESNLGIESEIASESPILSIDPEYFVFAENVNQEFQTNFAQTAEETPGEYLRGFLRATEAIAKGLQQNGGFSKEFEEEEVIQVLGATWGLNACKVPPSLRSGAGIKVAVLDTGLDLGHPDFAGRPIISQSFVGQPVQDLNGHGTHTTGTACGTKTPAGSTPRYGIGYKSSIFVGKVLTNAGVGTQLGVLAGMNWAIANRCPVISMSLGSQSPVHPAYTAAGQSALNNGCLIIAAAGNAASSTGAPANSPTIMSVAALDPNLKPSSFSNFGKIDIAGPGRDVFSSWPRPTRYKILSGTSMATPHVSGCAALWAETSPNLRGLNLWRKLQATAKRLPFPASRVGAGLVQAP